MIMKTIMVKDKIGEFCITAKDGERLHRLIMDACARNLAVTVDYSGVTRYATPFFNYSYGRLRQHRISRRNNRMVLSINLSPVGKALLRQVEENAKRRYKNGFVIMMYRINELLALIRCRKIR